MKLYDELVWRGLINDISSEDLKEKLNNGGMTFYIGTDPTGDSLHIGHFSSFLITKRLKDAGHHPIILIGGATGLIGDPKPNAERPIISKEELNHNYECLKKQITSIFDVEVVNNYDWSKDINFIDFLRDYGKYFNVNYMLDKDTVRRRLDLGITYTEFSYMIMQALDFLYLYEHKNCTMQVAGQDQWGNITAGIELIRKKIGKEAYAFTMPLITKSDGTKFGKSEGNAVWLDKNKTSSYEMYQFFLNSEDDMVIDYLKKLTLLSKEEIDELEISNKTEPHLRKAHKRLAEEVILFLHGKEELDKALKITEILFSGNIKELDPSLIEVVFKDVPNYEVESNKNIVDLLVDSTVCSSKREAREFITTGSITLNGDKITDLDLLVTKGICISNKYAVIRKGKKKYYLIKIKN